MSCIHVLDCWLLNWILNIDIDGLRKNGSSSCKLQAVNIYHIYIDLYLVCIFTVVSIMQMQMQNAYSFVIRLFGIIRHSSPLLCSPCACLWRSDSTRLAADTPKSGSSAVSTPPPARAAAVLPGAQPSVLSFFGLVFFVG